MFLATLVAQMVKKKKKKNASNAGDSDLIPGLGRSSREGNGNPLQYSCLKNPYEERSLAGYSPWGHKELDTTERLSTFTLRY